MLNVQGLGRNQLVVTTVPDGDAGTAETIDYARQLVAEGVISPAIRALALEYLDRYGVSPHDKLNEMLAIFDGVLADFQFRDDPAGTEMLQPVDGILQTRAGDCDDLNVILLCSLLGSIGFATRAITVKTDPERPDEASHVYMEAQEPDSGAWIPLDVARSDPQFGREPDYYWERREWFMTSAPRFLNGYASRGMGQLAIVSKSRFPLRGMGQFDDGSSDTSFNPSPYLAATPSILTGIAQVVKASNTPGIAYSGVGVPATGVQSGTGLTASVGGSSGLIVLGVLIVIGIAAFRKG